MPLSSFSAVGLVPVEDAIAIHCRASGINAEHVSTHTRASRGRSSDTKSSVMRYKLGDRVVSVSVVLITVEEGSFASASIFDTSHPSKRTATPLFTRGFTVGESLSLHEVVEAISTKLVSFLRA